MKVDSVLTSMTVLGLAPGEIPRVRLTFDSAVTVDEACRLANQYAGVGLGVQARRLDDQTWEFVLG